MRARSAKGSSAVCTEQDGRSGVLGALALWASSWKGTCTSYVHCAHQSKGIRRRRGIMGGPCFRGMRLLPVRVRHTGVVLGRPLPSTLPVTARVAVLTHALHGQPGPRARGCHGVGGEDEVVGGGGWWAAECKLAVRTAPEVPYLQQRTAAGADQLSRCDRGRVGSGHGLPERLACLGSSLKANSLCPPSADAQKSGVAQEAAQAGATAVKKVGGRCRSQMQAAGTFSARTLGVGAGGCDGYAIRVPYWAPVR